MRGRIFFYTIITYILFPIQSAATISLLEGVPDSLDTQGKVFTEAWLAFRQDMEGLCAAKVRVEESLAWFDAMPDFLLRDTVRLAVDHEVIYQAAARLVKTKTKTKTESNRRIIADLKSRYKGDFLERLLTALLISEGDEAARKAANAELLSPVLERRAAAGVTLAAAGERAGFSYFYSALKKGDEEARYAAWALGRFGGPAEEQALRAQTVRLPAETAFVAARGELLFKRFFPDDYRAFLLQFRFFSDGLSPGGLYESWFVTVLKAVSNGARDHNALRSEVSKLRRKATFGDDSALAERQIAAFIDFLDEVKSRNEGPTQAAWPIRFEDAEAAVHFKKGPDRDSERAVARRIASSIALISTLGPKIGYPAFAEPTEALEALSPNGDRAIDGNIATSWHVRKNMPLILDHPAGRWIESVRILAVCPDTPASTLSVPLTLSGKDASGQSWKISHTMDLNKFVFQKIIVDRFSAGRIQVRITESSHANAACIAEIRCQFRAP